MSGTKSGRHYFTDEFPDSNNQCTTNSAHLQSSLWPAYLPVNQDRIVIFERSKNAQLVVYTVNFRDKKRSELDPKCPLDINWESFGWTSHPTSNLTGVMERRLAWGYTHKAIKEAESAAPSYTVTLNALPSRPALLYADAEGRFFLQTTINGVPSRLWKIYVKINETFAFIPKVLFVDLFGTQLDDGRTICERIDIA